MLPIQVLNSMAPNQDSAQVETKLIPVVATSRTAAVAAGKYRNA